MTWVSGSPSITVAVDAEALAWPLPNLHRVCAGAVVDQADADASSPASGAAFYYLLRVALPWAPVQATYDPGPPADGYAGNRDAATACD